MHDFWDINSLSLSELQEIINLKKEKNLNEDQALKLWMRKNPGRIKHLGSYKNNEFEVNEISEKGVKEYKGMEALLKIIDDVIKRNRND